MILPATYRSGLHVEPLTIKAGEELAPTLRHMDRLEVTAHGFTPKDALWFAAMNPSRSWALYGPDGIIGAFGYSTLGTIWSLFTLLTPKECVVITKETPRWVKAMVEDSGLPTLANAVATANLQAVRWLKSSGAFTLNEARGYSFGGLNWLPFQTKPLSELSPIV